MEIRGIGSYGAPAPKMDPKTQAQVDINALERLSDDFKAAMARGDRTGMQQALNAMSSIMKDLQSIAPSLPQNIQQLIDLAAGQLKQIAESIEQVTPAKFDIFQGTLDTIRQDL